MKGDTHPIMSPFDAVQTGAWQRRASRYRRWSALLYEAETTAPLRAAALDMERRLESILDANTAWHELKRYNAVLLSEIDLVLKCMRSPHPSGLGAEALREESRLCREEVQAAAEMAVRRSFASRGFELAQLGEETARRNQAHSDALRQIRRWRARSEELRTAADQFAVPSAQEMLRRTAATYDALADNEEARLSRSILNEKKAKPT